ncbi:chorismate dehydratase [Paenibacillus shirakamiensis]|uniref:Chorismate dehydratase n=1 Tax=Paenibacillus shirakamiensis TaxID=1265935 RepID=A0ABS4JCV5_9BACL|nr:menaquinone biosynthesis protein [Paenibacillus shirakamiensis]MBP1999538.1 chorismate dehydratase [Paenibacillus shirakamiensis]
MNPSHCVRMGQIDYTNVWPVFHYFDSSNLSEPVEQIIKVPAVLNQMMLSGSLDIAPISSFAYGVGEEELLILPNLSVSSDGSVHSILLFTREPLEQIVNGRFALTNTSATSINLLKIILEKALKGTPSYWDSAPDLEQMMKNSDGALLIGDHAIRASWTDHGYIVTDLGEFWKRWTGYGMTFALWTVTKTFAENHPRMVDEVVQAFEESRRRSKQNMEPVIQRSIQVIGGTESYWRHYFNHLRHDFSAKEQAGLALYFRYAYEMGLLRKEVQLNIWSDNKLTRVKE